MMLLSKTPKRVSPLDAGKAAFRDTHDKVYNKVYHSLKNGGAKKNHEVNIKVLTVAPMMCFLVLVSFAFYKAGNAYADDIAGCQEELQELHVQMSVPRTIVPADSNEDALLAAEKVAAMQTEYLTADREKRKELQTELRSYFSQEVRSDGITRWYYQQDEKNSHQIQWSYYADMSSLDNQITVWFLCYEKQELRAYAKCTYSLTQQVFTSMERGTTML